MCTIMDTTCPIYVSAIDKKTGKAFVKQVDVPYRRPLKIEIISVIITQILSILVGVVIMIIHLT